MSRRVAPRYGVVKISGRCAVACWTVGVVGWKGQKDHFRFGRRPAMWQTQEGNNAHKVIARWVEKNSCDWPAKRRQTKEWDSGAQIEASQSGSATERQESVRVPQRNCFSATLRMRQPCAHTMAIIREAGIVP